MNGKFKFPIHLASIFFVLASLIGSAVVATPAYAATLTVTSNSDSGSGSLRDAIASAAAGDTITFGSDMTITLFSGLPISKNLTISGAGHSVTVSGGNASRVFSIYAGTVNFDHLTIANGNAINSNSPIGEGGAIWTQNAGIVLTVTDSVFANNRAYTGGAISNRGQLTLTRSTFSGNSAVTAGGIANYSTGVVAVSDSTFSGNSSRLIGGGVANGGTLTVSGSTFSSNSSNDGAGIENQGTLTVTNSTFSGNTASNAGGAIDSQNATLTVTGSTFSGNSSSAGNGGGIYNNSGTLTVANSTFSGNSAGLDGGGINSSSGPLTLLNSTLSGNAAGQFGAGFYVDGVTVVKNNIVANSAGHDCYIVYVDYSGSNNVADDFTCGGPFTQVTSSQINLGALADNGGPTQTMALLPGSVALDAGDDATCAAAPVNNVDQRGKLRPSGSHCDIGAYEVQQLTYNFSGFFSPLVNAPTVNMGSAGKAYPVKWQLRDANGAFVSSLSAVTSEKYKAVSCPVFSGDPTNSAGAGTTGTSGLKYDTKNNQYVYTWATPKTRGCYELFITLNSGQVFSAYFNLK